MSEGYEYPSATFELSFTDGRFAGLQVVCGAASVAQIDAIAEMEPEGDKRIYLRQLCAAFAEALVSWNVERRGVAVPATLDGLLHQDINLVTAIVDTWLDAVLDRQRAQHASAADREQADELSWAPHDVLTG